MATDKQPRLLTHTDLLSILESTEAELALAEEKLAAAGVQILDGIYEPGMFSRLVNSGAIAASTVRVDDKPAFIILHSRNGLGWLTVEGVASIGKAPLQRLFEAGDALARHFGSPVIQFVTRISSLFQFGCGQGFQPMGVILCKRLA